MSRIALALGILLAAGAASAQIRLDEEGKLTLYGDVRYRFESDWDSKRPDGAARDDRDRMRLRARLGFSWKIAAPVTVGARVRTGRRTAQQSPHLTFWDLDDNPNDPAEVAVDRWFVRFEKGRTQTWLGRDSSPFWKQNELFWDDDVTLTGATVRQQLGGGARGLQLVGGFYKLPDGMEDFAGNLAAGQAVYSRTRGELGFTLASGIFFLRGDEGARHLRNGNGRRDYTIWTASAQARWSGDEGPVTLGVDFLQNLEDYSADDPDPSTAANRDRRTGFVASVVFGETTRPGAWLAGYYYSHIETLAVNASFAQDDWIRWGSEGQTDASDLKGHELRFAMAVARNLSVVARLYLVEAISSVQDGKRFRADLDYRF